MVAGDNVTWESDGSFTDSGWVSPWVTGNTKGDAFRVCVCVFFYIFIMGINNGLGDRLCQKGNCTMGINSKLTL